MFMYLHYVRATYLIPGIGCVFTSLCLHSLINPNQYVQKQLLVLFYQNESQVSQLHDRRYMYVINMTCELSPCTITSTAGCDFDPQ